ncbi:MAG TPA: DUF4846 domain-containing protein [Bacteroidia bacterium]|jgi:hypothetical protein
MKRSILLCFYLFLNYSCSETEARQVTAVTKYCFIPSYDPKQAVSERIPVPAGYTRINVPENSFAAWLRHLPLKPGKSEVHLYNGTLKPNQDLHAAVINIDAGTTDIQQCADAVMRLRAEYLYSMKDYESLHFNFTSGHTVDFKKWSQGYRTVIKGNNVSWVKSAAAGDSYKIFRVIAM